MSSGIRWVEVTSARGEDPSSVKTSVPTFLPGLASESLGSFVPLCDELRVRGSALGQPPPAPPSPSASHPGTKFTKGPCKNRFGFCWRTQPFGAGRGQASCVVARQLQPHFGDAPSSRLASGLAALPPKPEVIFARSLSEPRAFVRGMRLSGPGLDTDVVVLNNPFQS